MFSNTPHQYGGPAQPEQHAPSGQINVPGQTPAGAYAAQNHQQMPVSQAPQMPQNQNTQTQARLNAAIAQLASLKSGCQQAVNPYTLRDRLVDVIEVFEYILSGQVSGAQSNQVPGNLPQYGDPNQARVQHLGVTMNVNGLNAPPAPPINNGDVQFVPAPAGGAFSSDGGSNGQSVEFYGGPAGSPHAGGSDAGQKVEFYGGPPQGGPQQGQALGQAPGQPFAHPGAGTPFAGAGTQAGNPVSNSPAAVFSPQAAPTMSVEAGGQVPQGGVAQAPGMPQAASFAQVVGAAPQAASESQPGQSPPAAATSPMPIP